MGITSSGCTRWLPVTAHRPSAVVVFLEKQKKTMKCLSPVEVSCSPWVIDDGWSDISGRACLRCFTAICSFGCPTLLGPNEKIVTEHCMWKTESRHPLQVITHSPPPWPFLIWAWYHHALQWRPFITVTHTRRVRSGAHLLGKRWLQDLSRPHASHWKPNSPLWLKSRLSVRPADLRVQTDLL